MNFDVSNVKLSCLSIYCHTFESILRAFLGVDTFIQGTVVQGDFCPRGQMSKEALVQGDFCLRKLLPLISLLKLFFPFSIGCDNIN